MRIDLATIDLGPRYVHHCLDMALLFLTRHLAPVGRLWLAVVLPVCGGSYLLLDRGYGNLGWSMLACWFATGLMALLLMAGAAPAAFGESFSTATIRRSLWRGGVRFGLWYFLMQIVLAVLWLACFPIALFVTLRYGFHLEQTFLAPLNPLGHQQGSDPSQDNDLMDLLLRGIVILLFCGLLWVSLFVTLDLTCNLLLGWPIFFGRLNNLEYVPEDVIFAQFGALLWNDPRVVTAVLFCTFLVYPVARLAWFFCYIDIRVRRDCWDLELQMTLAAQRLTEKA